MTEQEIVDLLHDKKNTSTRLRAIIGLERRERVKAIFKKALADDEALWDKVLSELSNKLTP